MTSFETTRDPLAHSLLVELYHFRKYVTFQELEALVGHIYIRTCMYIAQMAEAHAQPKIGQKSGGLLGGCAASPRTNTATLATLASPTSTMFTLAVPAWHVWTERRSAVILCCLHLYFLPAYFLFFTGHTLAVPGLGPGRFQRICSFPRTHICWVSVFVLAHALLLGQRICSTLPPFFIR